MQNRVITASLTGMVVVAVALAVLAAESPERTELSKLQSYIGEWRGVGQPRRGSNRGAWRVTQEWAWEFKDDEAALQFKAKDAKFLPQGKLRYRQGEEPFELIVRHESGQETSYRGRLEEGDRLVLTGKPEAEGQPARITMRQVADGDRMLVLLEHRLESGRFVRLAEVGFTREGSNFGSGTNYVECVVTGGLGTIEVSHKGKTYYVCCSGCRDYFNESPDEVLAEYQAKLAEKRKEK